MGRKDAGASQQPWFDSTRSRRRHLPTAGSSATLPLLGFACDANFIPQAMWIKRGNLAARIDPLWSQG